MKYILEFKLEYVRKCKAGVYIKPPDNCGANRHDFLGNVRTRSRIFDLYGEDGLAYRPKNRPWTKKERGSLVAMEDEPPDAATLLMSKSISIFSLCALKKTI